MPRIGAAAQESELSALLPLLRELGDLKRIRVAGRSGSLAEQAFRRAWAAVASGEGVEDMAIRESAAAVAAARLGGYDAAFLREREISGDDVQKILQRSFREVASGVNRTLRSRLEDTLGDRVPPAEPPRWVAQLNDQPRAGATHPGKPRLIVLPEESHGDHCVMVAVYALLLGPHFDAESGLPFLAGLAHHLHNALLPDSGFAGDEMLGEHLSKLMDDARREALDELSPTVRARVEEALALTREIESPEARAFHAADVLDRVLQQEWHARAAGFTLEQAMGELDLVHEGFTQAFHQQVLTAAGLP